MKNIKCKNCIRLINSWCQQTMSAPDIYEVRDCPYFRQKTNSDRLRQMNDTELAEFLCGACDCTTGKCPGEDLCTWGDGHANGILKWLQQPVEEKD